MTTVMRKRKHERQKKDQPNNETCIGTAEFERAVMSVGKQPYAETAEVIQRLTRNTIAYCVARGVPTPEEFVKQADKKNR
ncbi:MAG: hypothetical protein ACYDCO_08690 [Armatimonadota bacterium]